MENKKCEKCGQDIPLRNDIMTRHRFEIYWDYYLSIEKMLEDTRQYISPSFQNKNAYSDEFAKIILLACSEIDTILKFMCKLDNIDHTGRYYSMQDYAKLLEIFDGIRDIGFAPLYCSSLKEKALVAFPFKNLDKEKTYGNLKWWENYQHIKHDRMEYVELCNLENAFYALAAYYIVICSAMDYLDEESGKDYVLETHQTHFLIPAI